MSERDDLLAGSKTLPKKIEIFDTLPSPINFSPIPAPDMLSVNFTVHAEIRQILTSQSMDLLLPRGIGNELAGIP